MTLKNFFTGRAVVLIILLVAFGIVAGFRALNNHIYNEKQGDAPVVQVPDEPRVGENLEGEADPSRMTLGMNAWRWIYAQYNDGREVRPKEGKPFTLTFRDDGTFGATTDCNSVGGNYSARDGSISFTDIMMTEMYCEGSQDADFAELLENSQSYHFTSRGELVLDLKYDSGSVVFR